MNETLQMQTVREQNAIDISLARHNSPMIPVPVSPDQVKKLKIREFISWSVCCAVITALTGLMKVLKVGVTMDTVTSILFFISLSGLIFFISRIISLSRNPVPPNPRSRNELN
jgi:hypothetical protein